MARASKVGSSRSSVDDILFGPLDMNLWSYNPGLRIEVRLVPSIFMLRNILTTMKQHNNWVYGICTGSEVTSTMEDDGLSYFVTRQVAGMEYFISRIYHSLSVDADLLNNILCIARRIKRSLCSFTVHHRQVLCFSPWCTRIHPKHCESAHQRTPRRVLHHGVINKYRTPRCVVNTAFTLHGNWPQMCAWRQPILMNGCMEDIGAHEQHRSRVPSKRGV